MQNTSLFLSHHYAYGGTANQLSCYIDHMYLAISVSLYNVFVSLPLIGLASAASGAITNNATLSERVVFDPC